MSRFIDFHVHPPFADFYAGPFSPYLASLEKAFGREMPVMTPAELADYYRERSGQAVLVGWDAQSTTGLRPYPNARLAAVVGEHPDVFFAFGGVDPHRGAKAIADINDCARYGMQGLKFHPPAQRFSPADRIAYPLWEAAADLGLVVLIHTGYTAMGSGTRGGGGIELRFGDPMLVDRVAADFPDLEIVMAHPSWPWQEAAIAVAMHKENVHLELSGWSPKRFPQALVKAIRGPLAERTLFGTDFPFITPDKWLEDLRDLGLDEQLTRLVLHDNAARLLGV